MRTLLILALLALPALAQQDAAGKPEKPTDPPAAQAQAPAPIPLKAEHKAVLQDYRIQLLELQNRHQREQAALSPCGGLEDVKAVFQRMAEIEREFSEATAQFNSAREQISGLYPEAQKRDLTLAPNLGWVKKQPSPAQPTPPDGS